MSLLNQSQAMDTLLQAIAEGASLVEAAATAGVSVGAHYHWLNSSPGYKEGFEFAKTIRAGNLRDVLRRRAVDGYDEVKTFVEVDANGNEIVTGKQYHRKYDSGLAIRFLEAELPDEFTKRVKQEKTTVTIADTLAAARNRLRSAQEKRDNADDSEN